MILGFSLKNFFFWPNKRLDFLFKNLERMTPQANAIELSCYFSLKEILDNIYYLKKYKFRSFHLPKKGNLSKLINNLNEYQDKLKFDNLIIHPNSYVSWKTLAKSKIPVLIENMDNFKKEFRTQTEIKKILKKHSFLKLCLDINHLESQFPGQTPLWLNKFKNQIKEIHLSSVDKKYYHGFTKKNLRHSLCLYDKTILKNFKTKKYPIILEGVIPPKRWNLVKEEFGVQFNGKIQGSLFMLMMFFNWRPLIIL